MIEVSHATWAVDGRAVVDDVSLRCEGGHLVGLVGPNGSGKSSLLRLVAGLRQPDAGEIRLDGMPASELSPRQIAQRLAFVDQTAWAHEDYGVRQVVSLGRAPYLGRWTSPGATDRALVDAAMEAVEISHLADRRWGGLSGGERQRVHIARALAQDTPLLVLDEPLNHLDIRHQLALLKTLRRLAGDGRTVIVSLHDLNWALQRCDEVGVLRAGRLHRYAPAAECLTAEVISDVFAVPASVHRSPGERGHIVFDPN